MAFLLLSIIGVISIIVGWIMDNEGVAFLGLILFIFMGFFFAMNVVISHGEKNFVYAVIG
jgi:hypothetical protein